MPLRGNVKVIGYCHGSLAQCPNGAGDHVWPYDYYAVDLYSDNTAVYPLAPGKVVYSAFNCERKGPIKPCPQEQQPYYGWTVVIDHGSDEQGKEIYSLYAHLKQDVRVVVGQQVDYGTQIGTMSDSGCDKWGCGVHLHLSVRTGNANLTGHDAVFHPSLQSLNIWSTSTTWHLPGLTDPPSVGPISSPMPPVIATSATELVVDVSGSMNESLGSLSKLDAAKHAADNLIEMLSHDHDATGAAHSVGLIAFSVNASPVAPLTTDLGSIVPRLGSLQANGGTNLGAGLDLAANQLASTPSGTHRMVVVLTDGATNTGLPPDQIMQGPVQRLVQEGACLSTIGLGRTGVAYDEPFLRRLAAATACGGFYTAADSFQLENAYLRLSHQATGTIIKDSSGQIGPGQIQTLAPVQVPAGQTGLNVTLNWPGSRLGLTLRDPAGRVVDQGYPGAKIFLSQRPIEVVVANPPPGPWQATVTGLEVSPGGEPFTTIFSSRAASSLAAPAGGANGTLALSLVLVAAMATAVLVFATSQPGRMKGAALLVEIEEGAGVGHRFAIPAGATIGRAGDAPIPLDDLSISRQHAQLTFANGAWVIDDLQSANGMFVNRRPVRRARLRPGDAIRLGRTTFRVVGSIVDQAAGQQQVGRWPPAGRA